MTIHPDDALLISNVRQRELLGAAKRYRIGRRARRAGQPSAPPCQPPAPG